MLDKKDKRGSEVWQRAEKSNYNIAEGRKNGNDQVCINKFKKENKNIEVAAAAVLNHVRDSSTCKRIPDSVALNGTFRRNQLIEK